MVCFKNLAVVLLLTGLFLTDGIAKKNNFVSGYHRTDDEYQFMTTLVYKDADENSKVACAYLWIPPSCKKVRGVLVMNQNVLEQWLAEHDLIRTACSKSNLAILWCCPGFFVDKGKSACAERNVQSLQLILEDLAKISGYEELACVPWLPVGHSMTNNLVRQLINMKPAHILAAITMKGGPGYGNHIDIPILSTAGEYFEWNQPKDDVLNPRTKIPNYLDIIKERKEKQLPLSYFFDPNTGHFDCSETLTKLVADYIVAAAEARLSTKSETLLNRVDLSSGWVAGLPLPGIPAMKPKPFMKAKGAERDYPWYFNQDIAVAAADMANINWSRKSQIAIFAFEDGSPAPFTKGIVWPIPYVTGDDGVTFTLHSSFLKAIPDSFLYAGTKIGHGSAISKIILLCGSVRPVSENTFRIVPDRSYPASATYFIVKQEGNKEYRQCIEPGRFILKPNEEGETQQISFDSIPDIKANQRVFLHSFATSGMPVSLFVKYGPVKIVDNQLRITKIPLRAKFPIKVSIVATQWGRSKAPAVKTAMQVERTFLITK